MEELMVVNECEGAEQSQQKQQQSGTRGKGKGGRRGQILGAAIFGLGALEASQGPPEPTRVPLGATQDARNAAWISGTGKAWVAPGSVDGASLASPGTQRRMRPALPTREIALHPGSPAKPRAR